MATVEREPRGLYTYHVTLAGDEALALFKFIDERRDEAGGHCDNIRKALLEACPDHLRRVW